MEPILQDCRFVLAVRDLSASQAFYQNVLGFQLDFEAPGWAFLSRDRFRVMLGECTDAIPASELGDHNYFAYITVNGIDALYEEIVAKGGMPFSTPSDKPWGMREFGVRTPDGHRILFGQVLDQSGPAS